jgi:hypothetical protein
MGKLYMALDLLTILTPIGGGLYLEEGIGLGMWNAKCEIRMRNAKCDYWVLCTTMPCYCRTIFRGPAATARLPMHMRRPTHTLGRYGLWNYILAHHLVQRWSEVLH